MLDGDLSRPDAVRVASPSMDVAIGTTLSGEGVGFDTRRLRPLLLIGDAGRGKTTTARYLTRWWVASTRRHAHVFTAHPAEWADRPYSSSSLDQVDLAETQRCTPRTCLVVVDGVDAVPDVQLAPLLSAPARSILTSQGGGSLLSRPLVAGDVECLGLMRAEPTDPAEIAMLDGQARLDWPSQTVPVIPTPRGQIDFPCHRWQSPAAAWREVTR